MAASTSKSLKEYLKRYDSSYIEESEKKKKKKKNPNKTTNLKQTGSGVLIVDQDPVWQKPIKIDNLDDDENSPDEDKPLVDEDIEVKRLKRLEELKARRPYNVIAEDGSGWISVPSSSSNVNQISDLLPPRKRLARNDTSSPSPERDLGPSSCGNVAARDLSPPCKRGARNDTPSLGREGKQFGSSGEEAGDLSPPRKRRAWNYTPSSSRERNQFGSGSEEAGDLSLPCKRSARKGASPELGLKREVTEFSSLRRSAKGHYSPSREVGVSSDLSPPRRRGRARNDSPSPQREGEVLRDDKDSSPPRRGQRGRRHDSPLPKGGEDYDVSLPQRPRGDTDLSSRKIKERDVGRAGSGDLSPPLLGQDNAPSTKSQINPVSAKEQRKTGLITGGDIREVIAEKRKEDTVRSEQMDPSMSGWGAEPVYRDKKGARISKEEYLKSKQKVEEKRKEVKLEWGKGLAQKRELEAKVQELELEKDKPFARTRDDPDLDRMLKDRVRWGDPMAHLVKKNRSEQIFANLGDNEKMKESGFIIPQDIPNHSWIKRGLDAAPNRYGIKPGRHWDGVDRSNGYEKQLFKRLNEKQATEREAYLWSVSDM